MKKARFVKKDPTKKVIGKARLIKRKKPEGPKKQKGSLYA